MRLDATSATKEDDERFVGDGAGEDNGAPVVVLLLLIDGEEDLDDEEEEGDVSTFTL